MNTRITIVVDNRAGERLVGEHGLSLWIETEGRRILFDTGQGPALPVNARRLGVALRTADVLVLSHGHYDHTGGIPPVLQAAPTVAVYCHPAVVRPRYAIRDQKAESIGMPEKAREALAGVPLEHVHWVKEPVMLDETTGLTGPIPRLADYEDTGGPFYLDPEGTRPDPLEDDLALWMGTDRGAVVCLGCAHAGAVNTLDYICTLTGDTHVRAVIGGFHLGSAGQERLEQTIHALRRLKPDLVVPCHCTGESAVTLLRDALGESVAPGCAGATYQF